MTEESSAIAQLVDYLPYGETHFENLASDFDNDYLYTGKEYDEESSLYYYGARYYDPKIARFTGIDPWEGDLKDPQSLNKYAYVRNNPVKYVDPSGENWNDHNEFATKVIPYIDELQRQLYDVANLITLGTFEQAFDNMQTAANNVRQEGVNIETLANTAYQVAKGGLTVGGVSLIEGLTIGEMWMTGKGMIGRNTSTNTTGTKVEKTSPNELLPTEVPGAEKVKWLEKNISEKGFYKGSPVRYFKYNGDNYIVDGHHRAQAASNLGVDVYTKEVGESYFQQRWGTGEGSFVKKIVDFYSK